MNDVQHTATEAYLREVADGIGLRDWTIELERKYPDSQYAWAEVEVCQNHRTAWFRVAWPEFFDTCKPEDQRLYLIHEVCHILTDRVHDPLRYLEETVPDKEAVIYAKKQHKIEVERATDDVARAIAPRFPDPILPHTVPDGTPLPEKGKRRG